jgi:hypothetical protein
MDNNIRRSASPNTPHQNQPRSLSAPAASSNPRPRIRPRNDGAGPSNAAVAQQNANANANENESPRTPQNQIRDARLEPNIERNNDARHGGAERLGADDLLPPLPGRRGARVNLLAAFNRIAPERPLDPPSPSSSLSIGTRVTI